MPQPSQKFDFRSMQPELRAIALVGHYFQVFAHMEAEVDEAIAKILSMTNQQKYVLSSNMQFHNKIHTLSTLLDLSYLGSIDKRRYVKILNKMLGFASNDRNKFAHVRFFASPTSDGVQFFVVQAKGSLQELDLDWDVTRFEQAYAALDSCREAIMEIKQRIDRINSAFASILSSAEANLLPTSGFLGLGFQGLPSPPPQAEHTSATTSANPETDSQTPPYRQE
jgi:hypothetical protein